MKVYDILNNFKDVTKSWQQDKSSYWILIKTEEINIIKGIFSLDNESINECIDSKQPSKISFFQEYLFIVFNILQHKGDVVESKEMNIFLGENYIITVYKEELGIISDLEGDIEDSKNCLILQKKPEPYILLYYILDRIIVRNYEVISELEARTDRIEISVLRSPRNEQLDQLIHLRRQVYRIRKYLNPLRYIGDSLASNDNSIIKKEDIKYFKSLNSKIDKLMSSLESLVQDLALVREAFESEIANKTNELMKIFTMIATIFLPLNLISSMHGMNVKHIPFVNYDYGYYCVGAIMIGISVLLIYLFKRKKWL